MDGKIVGQKLCRARAFVGQLPYYKRRRNLQTKNPSNMGQPELSWVKININGACKQHKGHAKAACVIRDEEGRWKIGAARNLGLCSPLHAEL